MFVDEVVISVQAGKGGDGCVSFRREKFVPRGGPDGGNGGKGGDIVLRAVTNAHTLYSFRTQKDFRAKNGTPGGKNNCTGANGENLILRVPVGTQVCEKGTGKILVDLVHQGQEAVVVHGGVGGKGNAGFVSSVRQAPDFAEKGDRGEKLDLDLELKLVADVAIIGMPSVGKSTLISVISNARPKIAEYHFTTLVPNLGVAKIDDRELVFVDVPGLIEGASEGKGLGHQFLRHIERAQFVLHLIDVESDTPLHDFKVIQEELRKFSPLLAEKPFFPVFSRIDLTDKELEDFLMDEFEKEFGIRPYKISAVTHEGVDDLLRYIASQVPEMEPFSEEEENLEEEFVEFHPAQDVEQRDLRHVGIEKIPEGWELKNQRLERMVRQTDFSSESARERIYDVLRKWSVFKKLKKLGAKADDQIRIGEHLWEFRE